MYQGQAAEEPEDVTDEATGEADVDVEGADEEAGDDEEVVEADYEIVEEEK